MPVAEQIQAPPESPTVQKTLEVPLVAQETVDQIAEQVEEEPKVQEHLQQEAGGPSPEPKLQLQQLELQVKALEEEMCERRHTTQRGNAIVEQLVVLEAKRRALQKRLRDEADEKKKAKLTQLFPEIPMEDCKHQRVVCLFERWVS